MDSAIDEEAARKTLQDAGFNTLAIYTIPTWLPDASHEIYEPNRTEPFRELHGDLPLLKGNSKSARKRFDTKVKGVLEELEADKRTHPRALTVKEFDCLLDVGYRVIKYAHHCYGIQRLRLFIRMSERANEMLSVRGCDDPEVDGEYMVAYWLKAKEIMLEWSRHNSAGD
ncbi:hypothetical protein G7Y79_00021g050840 [Physcia stellaris]|nr:hypothetical protein G7Y79_00021g050840 [Physcia stellaris]